MLEEQYYNLLDAIEDKLSIPVYDNFVEPIESRGIPSFPLVILLFLLLLGGSLVILTVSQQPTGLQVYVIGTNGAAAQASLDGALVELSDESGVFDSLTTRKGLAKFDPVPLKPLSVRVTKEGFAPANSSVDTSTTSKVRLELSCLTEKACAELLDASGVSGGTGGSVPYKPQKPASYKSGGGESKLEFSDEDPDSPAGRILIMVRDRAGKPLAGKARVYDATSSALISEVDVAGGSGLLPGVEVGRKVFVNVFAGGYAPFYGNDTAFAVKPATNKLTVILEYGEGLASGVSVIDDNGSAVQGAQVSVYLVSKPEALYNDNADSEGFVSLKLGNGTYFAVAKADRHLMNYSGRFEAGQRVTIVLPLIKGGSGSGGGELNWSGEPTPNPGPNEAYALVRVVDESGKNVSYADVVLQQRTDFGSWFVAGQQSTTFAGEALFTHLLPQSSVKAVASYSELYGEASATLAQGVNFLNIALAKKPFLVKAFAYDPLAKQFVSAASFDAFAGPKKAGSCNGNGCSLTVVSGQDVLVNVSADGYIGSSSYFNLYEGVDTNVTLYLVSKAALSDTFVQLQGVYTNEGRPVSGTLKPGHSYNARLQVFSKNADQSGVVFDTQDNDVFVSGNDPQGFEQKGAYLSSCSASPVNYENDRFSWLDMRFTGGYSGPVAFNFTIDPSISLDAATKRKVLSLAYRSYIVRGSDYIRNPFDPALLNKPGENHPSGCPAASNHVNLTIKSTSTTCSPFACVSLKFSQGGDISSEGFRPHNQVLVFNETLQPFLVLYTVELFSAPSSAKMAFSAPANRLVMVNATDPIVGPGQLGNGKRCDFLRGRLFSVWNASFSLDLGALQQCLNYGLPLRFEGVATGRVLEAGFANVSLALESGGKKLVHYSDFTVEGFGVAANEHGIAEASLGQEQNVLPDGKVFSALSSGNCTVQQLDGGTCDVGYVNATFRITDLSGKPLSAAVSADSGLLLRDYSPSSSVQSQGPGSSITGVARFSAPAASGSPNITITRSSGGQSTALVREVSIGGPGVAFNDSNPFPEGWDTCNGFIDLKYTLGANPPFTLGRGCSDLSFRVSPVFPVDAIFMNVSIPDYGRALTRVAASDGSERCYELCEVDAKGTVYSCEGIGKALYNNVQYLLRYSPELLDSCPQKYKAKGNTLAPSSIVLEFGYTGDQTAKRNVTLHVLADQTDKSLYISPIYTFYAAGAADVSPMYPQLWAITNLKQVGKRAIVFKKPSNLAFQFDGPGVKLFSVYGGLGVPVEAYESSDLANPIFVSGLATSPLKAVSRYGEALAAKMQNYDLNSPYTAALTTILTESISQNSFLAKDVAEELSASIPGLSKRTAYWRSNVVVQYCQQTPACVSSHYTAAGCCKASAEAWMNYTVKVQYRQDSCVFCNNTFNPDCDNNSIQHISRYLQCTSKPSPGAYQCDQRCTSKAMLPPEYAAQVATLGVGGSGITLDVIAGNKLAYGQALGGNVCQLAYSSLNKFVSTTQQVQNPGAYTYYEPYAPKPEVSAAEITQCRANGNCPLVLTTVVQQGLGGGFGGGAPQTTYAPNCTIDSNNDGLWQPSEQLLPATFVLKSSSGLSYDKYTCASGQVVAVNASVYITPASFQNGKLAPRTVITSTDISLCREGYCPMVLAPSNAPAYANSPLCFNDANGNGFLDTNLTSETNSLLPATQMGVGGLFGGGRYGTYQCNSGQLAVSAFCLSACENYCSAPNCDSSPSCLPSGIKNVPTGEERVFNGWLNQSTVMPVKTDALYLSRGRKYLPAAWFSDAFIQSDGKPLFTHSYIVNSKGKPAELASLSKVVSVSGCGTGSDYPYDSSLLPEQGVYEIRDFNTIDMLGENWAAEAKALELPAASYLGERANQCRKPKWTTRMCELAYTDYSTSFGGCFNSILKAAQSEKRLGVDVGLLGSLGYGVKNGVGYGISPGGEIFALFEAGYTQEKCEGDHKIRYEYQSLHHWTPIGVSTGKREFQWRTDLGCNSDCGCKSGGYGMLGFLGLLLGLLGLFLPILWAAAPAWIGAAVGGLGMVTSFISGSDTASTAASVASNFVQTVSSGAIGPHCIPWQFGDAVAYACKGLVWQISGVG